MYGRVEALLPRVEELAAGRARLEAANMAQRDLSGARENALESRLLQVSHEILPSRVFFFFWLVRSRLLLVIVVARKAEASRRRWMAAYTELPAGANPKLAGNLSSSS